MNPTPTKAASLTHEALGATAAVREGRPREAGLAADVRAFEQFYRTHARYVAGLAFRLLGTRGEVDDVVQEVFLAAYRGLAALREPQKARAWLGTLTVRIARKRMRRARLWRWFRGAEIFDVSELAAAAPAPGDRAVLALVYRAVSALPVDERLAWVLRVVEGHELEAVAALCECSLATVKRRISRAQDAVERVLRDG